MTFKKSNGVIVAQMSDIHYCQTNLVESDRCFAAAVDDAIRSNADVAIITGDSTDHALDAHEPAMLALMKQIQRLANHCPVLMLQGTFSHEPPGFLRVMGMIGARHEITVSDRINQYVLNSERRFAPLNGPVHQSDRLIVSAVPTLNKADLIAQALDEDARKAANTGEVLFGVLKSFAKANNQARALAIPTMVISHGTVEMCESEHGVPMAGNDHEFGVGALFAAEADAVALGHIHKFQCWTNEFTGKPYRQVIAYPGSIGRFHHGELGEKGGLIWDMASGDPSFARVITPSRRTVDIFFEGEPDLAEITRRAQECEGAYVRVRYYFPEENKAVPHRDSIRAILSMAAGVQIEAKPLFIERQRAPGISTAATLSSKLDRWCNVTQTPATPLQERLALLQNLGVQKVADNFLDAVFDRPLQVVPAIPAPVETPVAMQAAPEIEMATALEAEIDQLF